MSLLVLLLAASLHGPAPRPHAAPAPPDSIGQEVRGGQRFVKHRVGSGETLFALARRYRVSVDQLTAANPQLAGGLAIGQTVLVPRPAAGKNGKSAKADKAAKNDPADAGKPAPARYTVAKGDNLYALARRYQISRDDIIRLNKLPADGQVKVGQQLLLRAEAGATEAVAATKNAAAKNPTTEDPRPDKPAAPDPDKPAQVATVTPEAPAREENPKEKDKDKDRDKKDKDRDKDKDKQKDEAPTRASEVVGRITESGLGAGIERSGTDKYLALHKTAPVGTIMQVSTPIMIEGKIFIQSVYVRVIGRLPDTGKNNNILVRVSPRALQKLGISDSRFRVETSYVP